MEPAAPSTASSLDHNGSLISGLQNTLSVKYEDLAEATEGFSAKNIIGKGGYGVVYRGMWKHTEVWCLNKTVMKGQESTFFS